MIATTYTVYIEPERVWYGGSISVTSNNSGTAALMAYAASAQEFGEYEYAKDVMELANRAGPKHPNCKSPD